jgi:uracil-DNA glycosylase
MPKQEQLDQIKADIVKDKVCSELAESATNLVFGDGNPDADIVFIGEAPGKNEDLQGLPFVGAAGKFLDEMLAGIHLKRAQVYITNIVKYRPPNNRDPLPEEKAEFLPYLERQLEVIDPLLVVTLGRHSMTCFLPDLQISQVHGQPKKIGIKGWGMGNGESPVPSSKSPNPGKIVILPLFHPAAALYNGALRQTLVDDFNNIPEVINLIRKSI